MQQILERQLRKSKAFAKYLRELAGIIEDHKDRAEFRRIATKLEKSPPEIPWKATIPIVLVLLTAGVGIWFLPVYGYYFEQRLIKYLLNGLASLSSLALIAMTIAWTVRGDYKVQKN